MKKKIISALLAAAMLLTSFAAVSATADDDVVAIDGRDNKITRSDFNYDFAGASKITLQKDVEVDTTLVSVAWEKTLDLNGHTLTYNPTIDDTASGFNPNALHPAIMVHALRDLTVTDSKGGGKIVSKNKYASAIQVGEASSGNSNLVVEGGTIEAPTAIFPMSSTTVKVNGGNIKGSDFALTTNGSYKDITVTINNGTMNGRMYLAAGNGSKYEINGGTFNGSSNSSAVEVKGGTMTINGGTFTNTATTQKAEIHAGGVSSSGYALAVIGHDGYQPVDVTVTGGTFNGVVDCKKLSGSNEPKLTITGGTFENDEIKTYATGDAYMLKPYIAEVGGKQYRSLPQAIGATTDTDNAIKMIADADLAYTVVVDKNITLDLNGKKISYFNGSENTRAIQVQPGATLTIQDGGNGGSICAKQVAVQCVAGTESSKAGLVVNSGTLDAEYAIFAASYADVTIDGGTLKGIQTIYTNGTHSGVNIVINQGTFDGAMFLAAGKGSNYIINDGTFKTDAAKYSDEKGTFSTIEIKGGNLTVNGGTFETDATKQTTFEYGNGQSSRGYVLAVIGHAGYQPVDVTVTGGAFTGAVNCENINGSNVPKLSLSGGSYTDDISKYVADDYVALKKDGKYNVTALEKTETKATAVTGDNANKIKEALTNREEGTTEKIDTFELSGTKASFVRAAYPITGAKNDTVNVDFDMSNVENLGNAKFGVLFYNIPAGITVGEAVISVAK